MWHARNMGKAFRVPPREQRTKQQMGAATHTPPTSPQPQALAHLIDHLLHAQLTTLLARAHGKDMHTRITRITQHTRSCTHASRNTRDTHIQASHSKRANVHTQSCSPKHPSAAWSQWPSMMSTRPSPLSLHPPHTQPCAFFLHPASHTAHVACSAYTAHIISSTHSQLVWPPAHIHAACNTSPLLLIHPWPAPPK